MERLRHKHEHILSFLLMLMLMLLLLLASQVTTGLYAYAYLWPSPLAHKVLLYLCLSRKWEGYLWEKEDQGGWGGGGGERAIKKFNWPLSRGTWNKKKQRTACQQLNLPSRFGCSPLSVCQKRFFDINATQIWNFQELFQRPFWLMW